MSGEREREKERGREREGVRGRGSSLQQRALECRNHGYLLSAKRLGAGSFSSVYLGYATPTTMQHNHKLANDLRSKNHNMVAIKIISIAPTEYSNKFLHREIYALNATYKHPGVIQLYDMFHCGRRFYLVLELAQRGDLLDHINSVSQRRGRPGLPEDHARLLFTQLVTALTHCHNNHIVHRDLKCENILLDEQGFVKITDFGFASYYTDRSAMMNTFCGSVAYTAPEILLSRRYQGDLADLWSLGMILFAMVMGKLPYEETHPRKLVQLLRQDLPFHNPVSSACQDLIRKLLKWQPSDRLPLRQVTCHPWTLSPPTGPHPPSLRTTKSDTNKTQSLDHKTQGGEPIGKVTGRSCQTGHAPQRSPPTSPAPPHRPDGRPGVPKERWGCRGGEEVSCPKPPCISPCRLLKRPTQTPTNRHRLFISQPRPPSAPRPFHNLPNFRKPGSASQGARHSQSGSLVDRGRDQSGSLVDSGRSHSGKLVDSGRRSHSGRLMDSGRDQSGRLMESGRRSQSGKLVESGRSQSGKLVDRGRGQSERLVDSGRSQSGRLVDSGRSQSGKLVDSGRGQSGSPMDSASGGGSKYRLWTPPTGW